jgi:hypothetical protein
MTLQDVLHEVEDIGSYARQHLPVDNVVLNMLDDLEQALLDAVYGEPYTEEWGGEEDDEQ